MAGSKTVFVIIVLLSLNLTPVSAALDPWELWEWAKDMASNGIQAGYDLLARILAEIQKIPEWLSGRSTKPTSSYLKNYEGVTRNNIMSSRNSSAYAKFFNDPLWTSMWYVQDYRTTDYPVMDLNVVPVYKKRYTGKGVTIAVVDDGVQHDHPDLVANYDNELAFDTCWNRTGAVPEPGTTRSHGTMCTGIIGMEANNQLCGVGIAYHAKVAGLKWRCEQATQYSLSITFVMHLDRFDIYSNSWGPDDNGKMMESYGELVTLAIKMGIEQGRNGKGAIYTFASGNGGETLDHCGADSMVNLEGTFAIASASQKGEATLFGERCAAIIATTYGGNTDVVNEENIVATDINGCNADFAGTSVSTPIASAIFALVLEARPDLTYRDLKHLIAMGAEVAPLANNYGWYKNGMGFWVNSNFGFGLLNAENMVEMARRWRKVPAKRTCIFNTNLIEPELLMYRELKSLPFDINACQGTTNEINYLEITELKISNIKYPYRGALTIVLQSPMGTKTELLGSRPLDTHSKGLEAWSMKSVHTWGENPKGTWKIEVLASDKPKGIFNFRTPVGKIHNFTFTFHGTRKAPKHYSMLPRKTYAGFRLPDGTTSE